MTIINPKALLAAQVYGAGPQAERQPAAPAHKNAAPAPRPAEAPRFQIEDQVTLRAASPAKSASAAQPAPDHTVPQRPRRPGSLVDIKA
jgi:hypothetical protein